MSTEHLNSWSEPSTTSELAVDSNALYDAALSQLPEELRQTLLAIRASDRQGIAELQAENDSYRKALGAWAAQQFPQEEAEKILERILAENNGATLDDFLPEFERICLGGKE